MTFYRHFASKDVLATQVLQAHEQAFWTVWDHVCEEAGPAPQARLEAVFRALEGDACAFHPHGCALTGGVVELRQDDHPAQIACIDHKHRLHAPDADDAGGGRGR